MLPRRTSPATPAPPKPAPSIITSAFPELFSQPTCENAPNIPSAATSPCTDERKTPSSAISPAKSKPPSCQLCNPSGKIILPLQGDLLVWKLQNPARWTGLRYLGLSGRRIAAPKVQNILARGSALGIRITPLFHALKRQHTILSVNLCVLCGKPKKRKTNPISKPAKRS